MKATLDEAGIANQDAALRQAAGQAFYNTSPFTLRDLRARAQPAAAQGRLRGLPRRLLAERPGDPRQVRVPQPDPDASSKADALGTLIEKFLDPLDQPQPEAGAERRRRGQAPGPRQPRHGHDLRGAGPPLQRGEQRGGRRALDAARRRQAHGPADLPAHRRPDRVRHLPALRRRLRHRRHADRRRGDAAASSPPSTASRSPPTSTARRSTPRPTPSQGRPAAQGRGRGGGQHRRRPGVSTLANDAFPSREFDFMLSNPPYGKSWKSDLERMGGKGGIKDPRFVDRARRRPGVLASSPAPATAS